MQKLCIFTTILCIDVDSTLYTDERHTNKTHERYDK